MTDWHLAFNAAWPGLVQTPAEIGLGLKNMLDEMSAAGPLFSDWGLIRKRRAKGFTPFDQVRDDMATFVRGNVARDEFEENPNDGFTVFGRSRTTTHKPGGGVSLTLNAGSKWKNYVALEAGNLMFPIDPSTVSFPEFKRAFQAISANWPCPWASLGAFPVMPLKISLEIPHDFPWRPVFGMAWMAYLSAERAAGLAVPHELISERQSDGGLLLVATEEPLDPHSPHHAKACALLNDILAERGANPAR